MSVVQQPRAVRDLVGIASYFDEIRESLSDRFLEAVEKTFQLLDSMPGIGKPQPVRNPTLQGLRSRVVQGFKKYVVFYLETDDGVEIVRVLYGSRDVLAILENES